MNIASDQIVSITEANQHFSRAVHVAERKGQAILFKNNHPKLALVDLATNPLLDLTDDEKIDVVARRVLKRFLPAFKELAK